MTTNDSILSFTSEAPINDNWTTRALPAVTVQVAAITPGEDIERAKRRDAERRWLSVWNNLVTFWKLDNAQPLSERAARGAVYASPEVRRKLQDELRSRARGFELDGFPAIDCDALSWLPGERTSINCGAVLGG